MGIKRNQRFRLPVVSRLTLAWMGAGGLFAILGAFTFFAHIFSDDPHRIALPLNKIENLAPKASKGTPLDNPTVITDQTGVRLAAVPTLRVATAAVSPSAVAEKGMDQLTADQKVLTVPPMGGIELFPGQETPPIDPNDVIITIAGESPKIQPATGPHTVALQKPPQAIPGPNSALMTKTALGTIPAIARDGRKAITYYAMPFETKSSKPKIALIIGGLGLNPALTEKAIDELPPEISLAFAPYAKNLDFWTEKARKAGHEILLELPMEGHGENQSALGAAALLSSRSKEENLQRMDWLMSRFGGYFAATNYLGSKFSSDEASISPILEKLHEAGVGYIDDTGATLDHSERYRGEVSTVNRLFPAPSNPSDRTTIRNELMALEKTASRDGAAIGKAYAYGITISEISTWAEELKSDQIDIAPASAVLQARARAR